MMDCGSMINNVTGTKCINGKEVLFLNPDFKLVFLVLFFFIAFLLFMLFIYPELSKKNKGGMNEGD